MNKICYGCGCKLQNTDKEKIGYTPKEDSNYCQRCFRLMHYGIDSENMPFKTVDNNKDLMIITDSGVIIRLAVDKISTMSRVTQGVKLINLKEDSIVSSTAIVDKEEIDNGNDEEESE